MGVGPRQMAAFAGWINLTIEAIGGPKLFRVIDLGGSHRMISTLDPERITYHSSDEFPLDPQGTGELFGTWCRGGFRRVRFFKNDCKILGRGLAEASGGSGL